MTRPELAGDVAQTVEVLSAKVRETVTLGKPAEAREYAEALSRAAEALDWLDPCPEDPEEGAA